MVYFTAPIRRNVGLGVNGANTRYFEQGLWAALWVAILCPLYPLMFIYIWTWAKSCLAKRKALDGDGDVTGASFNGSAQKVATAIRGAEVIVNDDKTSLSIR
jgi:hypothetical protein